MKHKAGYSDSDSAILLNLQIWMTASVCVAKVRRVGLSDEWHCSSWMSKIKQNHLGPVKSYATDPTSWATHISLCVICPRTNYVCFSQENPFVDMKEPPLEISLHIIQIELRCVNLAYNSRVNCLQWVN